MRAKNRENERDEGREKKTTGGDLDQYRQWENR